MRNIKHYRKQEGQKDKMTVDSGYPKSKSPQSPNKLVIIFTALEIKINGAKTSPSVFESGVVESQESGVRSRESRVES